MICSVDELLLHQTILSASKQVAITLLPPRRERRRPSWRAAPLVFLRFLLVGVRFHNFHLFLLKVCKRAAQTFLNTFSVHVCFIQCSRETATCRYRYQNWSTTKTEEPGPLSSIQARPGQRLAMEKRPTTSGRRSRTPDRTSYISFGPIAAF